MAAPTSLEGAHITGRGETMDILQLFVEYFGIEMLSETATITDLLSLMLQIGIALFLVCFALRSLFYLLRRY